MPLAARRNSSPSPTLSKPSRFPKGIPQNKKRRFYEASSFSLKTTSNCRSAVPRPLKRSLHLRTLLLRAQTKALKKTLGDLRGNHLLVRGIIDTGEVFIIGNEAHLNQNRG